MSSVETILERLRLQYLRAMVALCDMATNVQERCFEMEGLTRDESVALARELGKLRRDRLVLQMMLGSTEHEDGDALEAMAMSSEKVH